MSNKNGQTIIGPVDAAGRRATRDELFSAGELPGLSQLTPDLEGVQKAPESQMELFGRQTEGAVPES